MSRHPNNQQVSEAEAAIKRILCVPGVVGLLVINSDGLPIVSTFDDADSINYAGIVTHVLNKTKLTINQLDSTNELEVMSLRTDKREIFICPRDEYILIVLQNLIKHVPRGVYRRRSSCD